MLRAVSVAGATFTAVTIQRNPVINHAFCLLSNCTTPFSRCAHPRRTLLAVMVAVCCLQASFCALEISARSPNDCGLLEFWRRPAGMVFHWGTSQECMAIRFIPRCRSL